MICKEYCNSFELISPFEIGLTNEFLTFLFKTCLNKLQHLIYTLCIDSHIEKDCQQSIINANITDTIGLLYVQFVITYIISDHQLNVTIFEIEIR